MSEEQAIEITPSQDPIIRGQIKQDENQKWMIVIVEQIGMKEIPKFILDLRAETDTELLDILKDYVEKHELEMTVKQPAIRGTKIKEIIALHLQGKTIPEIIALGYHKSTVNTQVKNYLKQNQA